MLSIWKGFNPHKNKRGFTLLEAILALLLFASIQSLLMTTLHLETNYYQQVKEVYADDWGVFLMQLQREARNGRLIAVSRTSLKFKNQKERHISYEFYKNTNSRIIRKLVRGLGHQPYLMDVRRVIFTFQSPNIVHIDLTFINEEKHQATIYFQKPEEKQDE